MDVQCERCRAEYEFDDALISARGTTVKCTSCGHQFKIRRSTDTRDAAPDRWAVRTTAGRDLVFTSLRELQNLLRDLALSLLIELIELQRKTTIAPLLNIDVKTVRWRFKSELREGKDYHRHTGRHRGA